jgi:hypothetical protein
MNEIETRAEQLDSSLDAAGWGVVDWHGRELRLQ